MKLLSFVQAAAFSAGVLLFPACNTGYNTTPTGTTDKAKKELVSAASEKEPFQPREGCYSLSPTESKDYCTLQSNLLTNIQQILGGKNHKEFKTFEGVVSIEKSSDDYICVLNAKDGHRHKLRSLKSKYTNELQITDYYNGEQTKALLSQEFGKITTQDGVSIGFKEKAIEQPTKRRDQETATIEVTKALDRWKKVLSNGNHIVSDDAWKSVEVNSQSLKTIGDYLKTHEKLELDIDGKARIIENTEDGENIMFSSTNVYYTIGTEGKITSSARGNAALDQAYVNKVTNAVISELKNRQ